MDALEAYVDSLSGDAEKGLARLAESSNPFSIRRSVSILLDTERYDEVAGVIEGLEPHPEWAEKAIHGLVWAGEDEKARALLAWAGSQPELSIRDRCLLLYAQARYLSTFRPRGKNAPVIPGTITDGERDGIRDAL